MYALAGVMFDIDPTRDDEALFSATERQVLDLAWQETHRLLMSKTWLGQWIDRLTRTAPSLPLANNRLETLRQVAVSIGLGKNDAGDRELADAGFGAPQIAMVHYLFGSHFGVREAA